MSSRYYILKDKKLVGTDDVLVWGKWFEGKDRIIKQETLDNGMLVSTVFLGIDHNFGFSKKPLLFETMVFDTNNRKIYKFGNFKRKSIGEEMDMDRYSTYEEAEKGHQKMVKKWSKK